jgi:phosphate butyryltransferase
MSAIAAPVSEHLIASFAELRQRARPAHPLRLAVVVADDGVALSAADAAMQLGIAQPVLIGNGRAVRGKLQSLALTQLAEAEIVNSENPAATAVQLARSGKADLLLKGHLRTDEFLRPVLDKASGLRTGRLLSDVLLYEDRLAGQRLIGISDGGLNVLPNLEQKKQIVQNAIEVMRCLGLSRPKIAIMSASEAVSEGMPSSVDARRLLEMGDVGKFGEADIFGPLALDCALLPSAARDKGITHPVAGHADCMIVPNIEAGNLLGKSVKYLGGSQCAHVVVGAIVPILIPSRVESVDDKVNSIALGVLFASRVQNSRN